MALSGGVTELLSRSIVGRASLDMCLTEYGYHTGYVYHTKSVLVGIGVSVFVLRKGKRVGHAQGE